MTVFHEPNTAKPRCSTLTWFAAAQAGPGLALRMNPMSQSAYVCVRLPACTSPVYAFLPVCPCVCLCVRLYICPCVCLYVRSYVFQCVRPYICTNVCLYVCCPPCPGITTHEKSPRPCKTAKGREPVHSRGSTLFGSHSTVTCVNVRTHRGGIRLLSFKAASSPRRPLSVKAPDSLLDPFHRAVANILY